MLKYLFFLLLTVATLAAETKVEVFASNIDSNATALHAVGDVIVLYGDSYLSANEVIYDHTTQSVELFGKIMALKGADFFALGEYAKFDINEDIRLFEPFYLLDKSTKVWASTKQAKAEKNIFTLSSGMISGCNPSKPLWKIYFSEGKYNSDDKWMDVYNARLYFYNIPVFYFPYFGYSLDTKRRTGLLTPGFGISSDEGFYYEQPIYITTDDWWDLELKPQIRTTRGKGLYSIFRFADSNISKGEIDLGYFKEKKSYFEEFNLAHDEHYGFKFKYENYDVLKQWFSIDYTGQSGLYTDVLWMNDVDYLNLQNSDNTKNATSNQVFSRINMFYNNEEDYVGTYFKYYLDLSKESNNLTIQKLPIIQYHHYLDAYFDDHLFYNVDVKANNYMRVEGKQAVTSNIDIPIKIQGSIFENYIDVAYTSQLKGEFISFSGTPVNDFNGSDTLDKGAYGRYFHRFEVASHLTKAYSTFTHDTSLALTYTKRGADYTTGFYKDVDSTCKVSGGTDNPLCEFYNINEIKDGLAVEMTQFVIDLDGKQSIYHKLSQNISYDSSEERLGELESEFEYYVTKNIYYYNNTFYNHSRQRVTKLLNTLRYNDKHFTFSMNHIYDDLLKDKITTYSSYLTTDVKYRYNQHYSYMAAYSYDFENSIKKRLEVGFLYEKRCWNFGLRYVENNRPILTNNDSSSVYDKYIYFTVVLQPIGGSEINYKLSNTLEGS